ncbi:TetR family transcriptional regulator [Streptomyces sp. 150FB]|uniref:TetR family transcriptional regulator n=1 Tax=Streptomyces sp. 150FB TaxID=1576605 RepID=UPI000698CD8F|nr:TetR family transcriptional regulator [Streptomyces sp. 150FB]
MTTPAFQRARSAESKRRRSQALIDAARSLALEDGVASVTLTAIAKRAGVHHSAMRRYFDSHKEVLLQLAAEGWTRWSGAVCEALAGEQAQPRRLAEVLATTLAADPLFCDLLANVPLHLEHEVDVDRVIDFKKRTREPITDMVGAIVSATPSLDADGARDIVLSANALGATLWQVTHPAKSLAAAQERDPDLMVIAVTDFTGTLLRLLTATCLGIAGASRSEPERMKG